MKIVTCRDCEYEFDADDKYNAGGYYNQCRTCVDEAGLSSEPKKKAFTGFTREGDWEGIEIVDNDKFNETIKEEEKYAGVYSEIVKGRG